MFRLIPVPCVAHSFDVKCKRGLACWIDRGRGELDACRARLTGDEPHRSRMPEEAPPPINVRIFVDHSVRALLGSPSAATPATASADPTSSSSASAAAAAAAPH